MRKTRVPVSFPISHSLRRFPGSVLNIDKLGLTASNYDQLAALSFEDTETKCSEQFACLADADAGRVAAHRAFKATQKLVKEQAKALGQSLVVFRHNHTEELYHRLAAGVKTRQRARVRSSLDVDATCEDADAEFDRLWEIVMNFINSK